jgi:hypothetical protein
MRHVLVEPALFPEHRLLAQRRSEPKRRSLVELANANNERMTGSAREVDAILQSADIVYAVWHDPSEPNGVGTLLIKGVNVLRDIIASGEERQVEVNAIKCMDINQALALKEVRGAPELQ